MGNMSDGQEDIIYACASCVHAFSTSYLENLRINKILARDEDEVVI